MPESIDGPTNDVLGAHETQAVTLLPERKINQQLARIVNSQSEDFVLNDIRNLQTAYDRYSQTRPTIDHFVKSSAGQDVKPEGVWENWKAAQVKGKLDSSRPDANELADAALYHIMVAVVSPNDEFAKACVALHPVALGVRRTNSQALVDVLNLLKSEQQQ